MTAGKVMAAIKVDMCRQQPMVPQIVAARPSIVDLVHRRRRGNARVCLFGVPDPGATQKIYDQMLVQQHQHMLNRWQFDMKTERFVGGDQSATVATEDNEQAVQQRLQGPADQTSHAEDANSESNLEAGNRLDQQQSQDPAEEAIHSVSPSEASSLTETESSTHCPSPIAAGGRVKGPNGETSSPSRNAAAPKPYDKNVRTVTGTKKSNYL